MTAEEREKAGYPQGPGELRGKEFQYDAFENGRTVLQKKKGRLPAMGWNSWNAFGSGNTEALTKAMADAILNLGLDRLGYQYVVLDDGCYKPERVEGRIANEEGKFPSGFRKLADYIHGKGLKFGMYNDIGTNLCAGAAVGTCGHETVDARSYAEWGVDFLKVDNCYYLWDNATFSDAANARYVYAPNIRGIRINGEGFSGEYSAVKDGVLKGRGAQKREDYVTNIGTFDGTGPEASPVGEQSGELIFSVNVPKDGEYRMTVEYAADREAGVGSWLQAAVGTGEKTVLFYDGFLPETGGKDSFAESPEILVQLRAGENRLRLMNHRRQENTLGSYAAMLEGLNQAAPGHDILLSICEWGKTQPQNWGYKVGDSWRILNDITFRVGSDGDPGTGTWEDGYTASVTSQYNKAVIMDEFAGLDRGWNDPDMLMIGMNGLTETMCRTHMTMWCMMNAPLMLGLDLRRVKKGDALWKIIANEELIALNQDPLGIQAKRIYTSKMTETSSDKGVISESGEVCHKEAPGESVGCEKPGEFDPQNEPDKAYTRDNDRVDILAKPLADGSVALSFLNLSQEKKTEGYAVDVQRICRYLGEKLADRERFLKVASYRVRNLWTGEEEINTSGIFRAESLEGCDNLTLKVTPNV